MCHGMVRPAYALAVLVALIAPAAAASLPSRMGMYAPQGTQLAMLDSKVVVSVHGPIAEATIAQTFRNDSDRAVEATYIFPLPPDAAVTAMEIDYGNRKIHASIVKREDAQRRYEDAVAAGLGAGLLDQERPDVFTQTVSAVPAHGTVVVTLRYDTVARFAGGTWQLALPMVVAPRYVPGTASGRATTGTGRAPDTDRAPDASRVTPSGSPNAGGKTEVALELADVVEDVTSPTHELQKRGGMYVLVDEHSDHDAIVRWRAKAPATGWVEQDDDGGYAAVIVEAPAAKARGKAPLRAQIIVDLAATTRGDTDMIEHPLVRSLLGAFDAKDSVSVTGSIQTDWRAPDDVLRAVELAWSKTNGAFDLTRILVGLRGRGGAIVLVTDGLVADDRAAIAAARQVGAPIHVIGVGPSPNRSLLQAIAAATNGTVRFAVVGDDLGELAKDAIADVAMPPGPLGVTWGTLAAREVVPAQLPRLGTGQAALLVARVTNAHPANARARGDVFAFASIANSHPPAGATTVKGPLARRWARARLDELVAVNDRGAIATHALRYGLVSPATSMIAIGDEVVVEGGVKHTVQVPVSVPAGMQWQEVKRELAVDTNIPVADADSRRAREHEAKRGEKTASKPAEPKADKKTPVATKQHAPPPAPQQAPAQPEPPLERDQVEPSRKYGKDDTTHETPPAPTPAPPSAGSVARSYDESEDAGESRLAEESISLTSGSPIRARRQLRLSLAFGGSVVNGNVSPLVATRAGFDVGGFTRFGVEGSLWFLNGLDVEGTLLGTFSRIGVARRLDLQAGLGLHLGNGLGPAGALELRLRFVPHVASYLRYDGALLLHDKSRDGQNAGTVGVEASF
jgi:Ca-activated chloride channel family protein